MSRVSLSPSSGSLRPSPVNSISSAASNKVQLAAATSVDNVKSDLKQDTTHNSDNVSRGVSTGGAVIKKAVLDTHNCERSKSNSSVDEVQSGDYSDAGLKSDQLAEDTEKRATKDNDTGAEDRGGGNGIEDEGEDGDGGGWERVSHSRCQSRNSFANGAAMRLESSTDNQVPSGGTGGRVEDDPPSDENSPSPESSPSSTSSPQTRPEMASSGPNDSEHEGESMSVKSVDSRECSTTDSKLTIEDLASGSASQLLSNMEDGDGSNNEEEKKTGESDGLGGSGNTAASQGLSQSSDKVRTWCRVLPRI